ncbi:putative transcription factor & chromatin remodeling DDT family [Dioscorea sansibarensis]
MEIGEEGKKSPEMAEEKPSKRKMKSPYQLEVLEKTYAVQMYPSEELRAELSAKIGLSDRQLQMWFCHRRLKDRKLPPVKRPRKDKVEGDMASGSGPSPNPLVEARKGGVTKSGARNMTDKSAVNLERRYYDSMAMRPSSQPQHLSAVEMRVIAAVEAQLGEPLRENGPILGMEFDPLPPGAFGEPIESDTPAVLPHGHSATHQFLDRLENSGRLKLSVRSYDAKLLDRHDGKSNKLLQASFLPSMEHSVFSTSSGGKRKAPSGVLLGHPQEGTRALQEYKFLPEQPSVCRDAHERVSQPHYYDSTMETPNTRVSSLSIERQFTHGIEQLTPSNTFHGQMSNSNLSQHGRQQMFVSSSTDYDNAQHSRSYSDPAFDAEQGIHSAEGIENPSDRRICHDEDASRMSRKRKSEEARIAKEVEAHEKRIRKELEKQDILRRKEQMRKEMERHDRERRKEEERLMREKQREFEKYQREEIRESKRREKVLLKESIKAEKLRLKEEMRREKEAAKLKAAIERATARKIAKGHTELVEDEHLELMELAAASKGLPSIITLDSDTLQQLDVFKDMLSPFPPASVPLKRPFAIPPWANSEENIGNLLMLDNFMNLCMVITALLKGVEVFITFADLLELWPFTLDEFVQALHDYDSRLLGEIHVALLKSIIKDIEDVARIPSLPSGTSQTCAANPGGGHPHVIEGAYSWGFDICSWQRHLNFMTWPEILRQFALSAGFGPKLTRRNVERTYFLDENEGNDDKDVITTLRSGAAVEHAVALMREKGFTHQRRSRNRLTPGTVKFAAFHVLSLEGSKGLTILEVADKIQKSGLRDLRTSKTPEASIAAALSRDTRLFERTAPSTYCVRQPYRKDPSDADVILSDAREKIQVFQNGFSDGEEAEKDVDDAERDEDSECDGVEDPEVDDICVEVEPNPEFPSSNDLGAKVNYSLDAGKGEATCDAVDPQNGLINIERGFSLQSRKKSKDMTSSNTLHDESLDNVPNCLEGNNPNQDILEVDESNCQPWVQGLTEDEYCDLSVEERLEALVALIGVAIEGNSIHAILEERLEAANALKKQMWAEAQLDRRRVREEYASRHQYSSVMGYKVEMPQMNAATEGNPLHDGDNKGDDGNFDSMNNGQFMIPQNPGNANNIPSDKNGPEQECPANTDIIPPLLHGYTAESRSQLKSYIGHKAEEMYVYRSLPLGQDRRHNRYWLLSTSMSRNDLGSGRIFFESRDGFWRLIDSEEPFDALLAALDARGVRESHLLAMLRRIETTFKETIRRRKNYTNAVEPAGDLCKKGTTEMASSSDCSAEFDSPSSTLCGLNSDPHEHSSSFTIELGRNEVERNAALKRYQGFLSWMWKESYNPSVLCAMKYGKKRSPELLRACQLCYLSYLSDERHCPSCHKTFKSMHDSDTYYSQHIRQCEEKQRNDPDWKICVSDCTPIRIRLLKVQMALVEASIPAEALQPFWTESCRTSWGVKLHLSSSADELFQVLTLLEGAIKRDFLCSSFETTEELLNSTPDLPHDPSAAFSGPVPVLPWIPETTAAVALRLLDLDASTSTR